MQNRAPLTLRAHVTRVVTQVDRLTDTLLGEVDILRPDLVVVGSEALAAQLDARQGAAGGLCEARVRRFLGWIAVLSALRNCQELCRTGVPTAAQVCRGCAAERWPLSH